MNLNREESLPKQYGFKALNNFTNLSLWIQYTDTMLVESITWAEATLCIIKLNT